MKLDPASMAYGSCPTEASGNESRNVRHALIPAAGRGTRVRSITGSGSKELLRVAGEPIIAHTIREAFESGCSKIGVIVRRDKEGLVSYLRTEWADAVQLLWQSLPEGLGKALLAGRAFVGHSPFAVLLPDDLVWGTEPAIRQLIIRFRKTGKGMVGVTGAAESIHSMFADCGRIGLVEDKRGNRPRTHKATYDRDEAVEERVVIGRYVFPPASFDILDAVPKISSGELGEGPVLRALARRGDLLACAPTGTCLTVGVPDGYHTTKERTESPG